VRGLEVRAKQFGIQALTLKSTATAQPFYRSMGYADAGAPTKGYGITMGQPMNKRLWSLLET
jgi:hypothetical protein